MKKGKGFCLRSALLLAILSTVVAKGRHNRTCVNDVFIMQKNIMFTGIINSEELLPTDL